MQLTLDGTPQDVSVARRALRSVLGEHFATSFIHDAILLTSEIVSNATMHAAGATQIVATVDENVLRVEVSDGSRRMPRTQVSGTNAAGGRGIRLVESMSSSWGVVLNPQGKTVWFEMTAP